MVLANGDFLHTPAATPAATPTAAANTGGGAPNSGGGGGASTRGARAAEAGGGHLWGGYAGGIAWGRGALAGRGVRVEVKEARHLPKMDMVGTCDAFVRVGLGRQTRTTGVVPHSCDAVWDASFDLEVGEGAEGGVLRLDLFDHDKYVPQSMSEQYIGSAQVDLPLLLLLLLLLPHPPGCRSPIKRCPPAGRIE